MKARVLLRSALIAGVLSVLLTNAPTAGAEGPGTGGRRIRLDDEPVGPYLLRVVTSPNPPQVGSLYVEVRVQNIESDDIIREAVVNVAAWPVGESSPALEVEATHAIAPVPTDYAAHLPVPQPGDWTIEVQVDYSLGPATTRFQEHVVRRSTLAPLISAGLPFAGLALLIIIFLLVQRKDNDSQSSSSPDSSVEQL